MAFKFILKNVNTGKSKGFEVIERDGDFFVGRGKECDLTVGDGKASSKHFKIVIESNHVSVEDLGSRNGIFIDGIEVKRSRFYTQSILEFACYQVTYDRKSLTPKESVVNSRKSVQTDRSNDITLVASADMLEIDRGGIAFINEEEKEKAKQYQKKEVTLLKKIKRLKKNKK